MLTAQQLLAIFVADVFTLGFELIRKRALFGKLGMAIAADPEMASAIGANTTVVAIVAFATSGLFAGVAGVLIGPSTFANPYLGDTFGTFGYHRHDDRRRRPRNPRPPCSAGCCFGVLSEGANALINSQASDWFPFLVLVIILIVTPEEALQHGKSAAPPLARPSCAALRGRWRASIFWPPAGRSSASGVPGLHHGRGISGSDLCHCPIRPDGAEPGPGGRRLRHVGDEP